MNGLIESISRLAMEFSSASAASLNDGADLGPPFGHSNCLIRNVHMARPKLAAPNRSAVRNRNSICCVRKLVRVALSGRTTTDIQPGKDRNNLR